MAKKPTYIQKKFHVDRRAGDLAAQIASVKADPDQMFNTDELAKLTGLSPHWLEQARFKGIGPPFVRVSPRVVMYRRRDLLKWLEKRTHLWTGEYQGKAANAG